MLANNIANASAPGFKADREYFGLYLSQEAADSSDGANPPTLPVIERQWTDFTQGSLTDTGNPLDLALSGKGFFVANAPTGQLFTRDGSFRISPQGDLVTLDGYPVQGQDGKAIHLDNSQPVEITPDGAVKQGGQQVAQLSVVDFPNASAALGKRGNNYFGLDVSDIKPSQVANAQIQQGKLEAANSQPAESAVRLVNILRQFETLQKAMSIGADMNKQTVEQVARATQ